MTSHCTEQASTFAPARPHSGADPVTLVPAGTYEPDARVLTPVVQDSEVLEDAEALTPTTPLAAAPPDPAPRPRDEDTRRARRLEELPPSDSATCPAAPFAEIRVEEEIVLNWELPNSINPNPLRRPPNPLPMRRLDTCRLRRAAAASKRAR